MATKYVDPLGTDAVGFGANTGAAAYATLDYAAAQAAANDTILVGSGVYTAPADITKVGQTIGAYGATQPIFYGGSTLSLSWSVHAGNVWKANLAADPLCLLFRTSATLHPSTILKGFRLHETLGVGDLASELQWTYSGGIVYVYSAAGNPGTVYYAVDYPVRTGTVGLYAGGLATGGIYVGAGAHGVTIKDIMVLGWNGNGLLADDVNDLTCLRSVFSFNREDGHGGFGMVRNILRYSSCSWNGVRRALSVFGLDILPDGDGHSTHLGAVESTDGLVDECYFEGNTKDAVQNINGATGTVQNSDIVNCNYNLIYFATGAQTFRNLRIRASANDLGAFALGAVGTATLQNITAYGSLTAGVAGINSVAAGTLNMTNCIVTNFDAGASILAGTFNHTYNCWGGNSSLGVVLGTGEISTSPALLLPTTWMGIRKSSPCFGTGTDLTGSGVTKDRAGKARTSTMSMGAMEPVVVGRNGGRRQWLEG